MLDRGAAREIPIVPPLTWPTNSDAKITEESDLVYLYICMSLVRRESKLIG